jgi:hypothetical protein
MIRKIDETSTDSWLRRAPAAGEPEASTHVEKVSASLAPADRSQGGWDPMEVWLRYIELPRRLRQHATPTVRQRRG